MGTTKGRPHKYTDQELKEILLKYSVKYKGKENYLQLEKVTGIKRHVWARRLGQEIKKLNEPIKRKDTSSDEIPLPNIEEIVERYGDNKVGLIRSLGHLNEVIMSLYEKVQSNSSYNRNLQQLKQTLKEKEETITKLKNEVKYYKQLYEQAYVKSTYSTLRNEENLKDNLISMSKNKDKSLNANIEKAFPELFSDN